MSDGKLVNVKCHHSGEFQYVDGELNYVNGEVEALQADSASIFEDVIMNMVNKIHMGKIWYKLPFEDFQERKPLWEKVDENKKKMNKAACYLGVVDIIIESPDCVETNNGEDDTEAYSDSDEDYVPDGEEDGSGDEDDDFSEFNDTDDDDDDSESDEVAEEDLLVFDNNNYDDEIPDEDEVYPDTESDDEEEQAEKMARDGSLDGVFSLGQTFYSKDEFKKNVIKYVLKERRNVVLDRWETTKHGVKCIGKGCNWRIYCSIDNSTQKWKVSVYENKHTCHPTGKCRLIRSPIISEIVLEDVRRNPTISAPEIEFEMKKRFNIIITPNQAQNTRRKAIDKIQDECNEQFARLRDDELELLHTNPGTTVEINTTTKANGKEGFSSFYVCFDALRLAWKQNCRPIIGLDGTFLKNSLQGMLLTAVGRDPNNQIYPIAWAAVSVENNDNWQWFIQKLKEDLQLGNGEDVTIISDMHRGLINGVSVELPRAEHRACARHIYSNLKKKHKSDMLKPMFWRIASSYTESDFERNLLAFREFDANACDELLKKDHRTWCRAFFRTNACCADTHNNLTESFNRTLKIARKKPFVEMLELIRRDAMQRIANRFKTSSKETGKYTPKARKEVAKSCEEAQNCYSIASTNCEFEIVEFGIGYSLSLINRRCICRKWDLTGIPCRHAVCAIREHGLEVEDFISPYYLTSKWQDLYHHGLRPVNGLKFWKVSGLERIEAPPYKRPPGRPPGKARIKGVHESPKKSTTPETRLSRKGQIPHCGLCGSEGHNIRRCPNESEEDKAKRRRLNQEARMEAQMHAQMEAQVESSQVN